jgi:hypothetical protein
MTKSDSKAASEESKGSTGTAAKSSPGTDRDTIMAVLSYVPIVCLVALLQDDPSFCSFPVSRHSCSGSASLSAW